MAVRYDTRLTRAIAREIAERWRGVRALGLGLDAETRVVELGFEAAPALVGLLHPQAGQLFAEPGSRGGGITAPVRTRFRHLALGAVEAPPDERRIELALVDRAGLERHRVVFELHSNQWNALLLDPGDPAAAPRIRELLRPRAGAGRELRRGGVYQAPVSEREGAESPVSGRRWRELLGEASPSERRGIALRQLAGLSSLNADHVLGDALSEKDAGALDAAYERYRSLRSAEDGCWTLQRAGGPQPYVASLDETDACACDSLLDAMREAAHGSGAWERFFKAPAFASDATSNAEIADAEALRAALAARRRRLRKRLAALRRELETGGDPEELRSIGNLLLARLHDVPRGVDRVELADFDGARRRIILDPALGPAANADAYFAEAARRERAIRRIPDELATDEAALAEISSATAALAEEGPSERLWEIVGGRTPQAPGPARRAERRLPYRRFRSSGGLEIRVGRSARDNDELTLRHSSSEDIWLHARAARGAHVILRWGRREENPPERDLHEAAVVAAVHSGGRHSGTVAVDWTRRKYVRKRRKAPAGTVTIERAKTLFVEPDEALVARLGMEE